jgi:hypothetical protein
MDFNWYEQVKNSDSITQGDLIFECLVPEPDEIVFKKLLGDNSGEPSLKFLKIDSIILSQACDIINDKISNLIVCPLIRLKDLTDKVDYYRSSNGLESIRQGKEPAYHLLNEYNLISFPFSVVDFHRIYSMPKHYLKEVAKSKPERLRLLPPYREHLSQAFARYFMRVGLPQDIDKDKLKLATK